MTPTTTPTYRYAIVRNAATREQVENYLPDNYWIINEVADDSDTERLVPLFVIEGEDKAGWTLADYVKPRLESGLYPVEIIDVDHPAIPSFVRNPDRIPRNHPLSQAGMKLDADLRLEGDLSDFGGEAQEAAIGALIERLGLSLTPAQYIYFAYSRAGRGQAVFPELDPGLRAIAPTLLLRALAAAYMDGLAVGYEASNIAHRKAWETARSTP